MLTHKTHPTLDTSDTLYSLIQYSDLLAQSLGQDVGWTNLSVTNTTVFNTVASYPLQAKRLGKLIMVRGMVQVKTTSGLAGAVAVTLPSGWQPGASTFGNASVYTNGGSGVGVTMPLVQSNRTIIPVVAGYHTGTVAVGNSIPINMQFLTD